ncbi:MAG: hypothetical protein JJ837_04535 [Prochlorococcus marinus XMU1428]|nr:hypothetical protein [Prochlorococcus marinus XMU1428]
MFKKKFLLLTLFLIIIFQTLIYTNNNQKTSFRYFKWVVQDVSIGKLINISFFSGLFISALLNTTITNYKKNNLENIEDIEKSYETLNNEKDIKSNVEMPPLRDIRDTQPTISVNYRVVRNIEEKNLKNEQNYSNSSENKDDWDNDDNEW